MSGRGPPGGTGIIGRAVGGDNCVGNGDTYLKGSQKRETKRKTN